MADGSEVPAFDLEQAGIVCDRLAAEIARAAQANPAQVSILRQDARDLLACASAWLQGGPVERSPTFPDDGDDEPQMLAAGLRELAEYLLALADEPEARGGRR